MKDILALLILLTAQTIKVCCSQPYLADSDGNCRNKTAEYLLDDHNLCCKKCRPGERVKQACSETTDTECEPCPAGQFKESWNYSPTCFTCSTCRPNKNLQDFQKCSPTTRSKCGCKPGTFCIMGFDEPYCEACRKYYPCKVGYGVSTPGTANSDVKCQRCPDGTFSDMVSNTDRCRPHTICSGRVVKKGNTTSDTMCEPAILISGIQPQTSTKKPHPEIVFTTASMTVPATSDATLSNSQSLSAAVFNHSTKSPQPSTLSDSKLAAIAIPIVIGVIIFVIILILLCHWKIREKEDTRFPKVDANGNCETGDKINQCYLGETQLTSFTVTAPEQQYLLENGETCSDQSQSSNTSETFTRTDGCSSCESIGPLQSTLPLDNPHSALSEPRTLQSNTEPVTPQTSVPTQCSSQPASPQIISPVTPSPQVNVNIILNIGNGSGGTPSVVPTDLMQVDSKLRFGEEEESFSIPQQEDGKQSLMSVQETESYSV